MFFWKGKNLILSAEHSSVVQKQGSRGSVAERCLYAEMMKIRWQIHPEIDDKSMTNQYKIVVAGRYRRTPKGPWLLLNWYLGLILAGAGWHRLMPAAARAEENPGY